MPNLLQTNPFLVEYWRDRDVWPAARQFNDINCIFLLDAFDRFGRAKCPGIWNDITQIYRQPDLFQEDTNGRGSNETINQLLYQCDLTYEPNPRGGDEGIGEPEIVFTIPDPKLDLAASIGELPPLKTNHVMVHTAAIEGMIQLSRSGQLPTFIDYVDPKRSALVSLNKEAWLGGYAKVSKRFVFGQLRCSEEGACANDDRGQFNVFVDAAALDALIAKAPAIPASKLERDIRDWMIEIDKSDADVTTVEMMKDRAGKQFTAHVGEPGVIDRAYRLAKPTFTRLGQKGPEAGSRSGSRRA